MGRFEHSRVEMSVRYRTHDSVVVAEANAREQTAELRAVGCRFMTVDNTPRRYYPADMAPGLVRRVAALVAGRDDASRTFRRLAREELRWR
jgi:hypothetical protein